MNILVLGDVFGQQGREAVKTHLSELRRDLAIDIAIVNAENAAHGFGLTEKISGDTQLNVSTFAQGLYLLRFSDEAGNSVIRRFVKE